MAPQPEESRLESVVLLKRLALLDTDDENVYTDAVSIAARVCAAPLAAVSLGLGSTNTLRAGVGLSPATERAITELSRLAIITSGTIELSGRALDDHECAAAIGYFRAIPLFVEGHCVGALSVGDARRRFLDDEQQEALLAIGRSVSAALELRLLAQSSAEDRHELHLAVEEAKEKELLLRHSAERFENLFAKLPVACMTLDTKGHIMEWNAMSEKLYGFRASEVLFKKVINICVPKENRALARQRFAASVKNGGFYPTEEWSVMRKDGSRIWVLSTGFPLHGPNGDVVGMISTNVDITDRKKAEAMLLESNVLIEGQRLELEIANSRLETLAFTDGLTGLNNHRAFQDTLLRAFVLARRHNQELSVILLDVDRFKAFNDDFGHLQGDAVLRKVAEILRASARESDFVGRYGGEEFAVVLPNTDLHGAGEVAERMRRAISDATWPERQVTASFGVASLTLTTSDTAELIGKADEALYQSKDHGRNRVTLSQAHAPSESS